MSSNRQSAASRLLGLVAATRDAPTPGALAHAAGVTEGDLEACRRGERALSLEGQLRLAATVAGLEPPVGRAARQLYAQAQAALRLEAEASPRRLIYPREHLT